ncbi:D-alanyl-D-alanine carboxypeptidase [Bradyrhizobium lablabi]|uniref:D-alanyl-D-alanine carboxypeptidase n=1 Tax=Bradyrhizobium lablabi TaxID=722472 RepID=A0A1M6XF85_9BRAD|nr:M15 family metallopeptidase [Bradyrhizobium lablabi]SHL04616.1 D-alanyl-D-alanine carboxypeptidase [Bradyrhizobium lablabi]
MAKAATAKKAVKKAAKKTVKKTVKRAAAPRAAAAPSIVAAAPTQTSPETLVDIPAANTFNQNLSSASEATMLGIFGVPGAKTQDCSPATGAFKQRIVSLINVGPFKVSGLDIAVQLLKAVFDEAEQQIPNVVAAVKSDGMLCVRHKRMNASSFSNHSWGTAIDLFFGHAAVPQGSHKTHRGCLQLAPFFNRHGWYWGAGFSRGSVDSMHFELAEQTIRHPPPTS